MKFEKGKSGNPSGMSKGGRPRGSVSGRVQALQVLDALMGERQSKRTLRTALAEKFNADAYDFFKTIIMPLLPKDAKLSVTNDGIVEWKSLIEAFPKPVAPAAPPREE